MPAAWPSNVLTNAQIFQIVSWMVKDVAEKGEKGCARTIRHFPQFFRCGSNANFTRAMRYWKSRLSIISRYRANGRRGNGNYFVSRSVWTVALEPQLLSAFCRFRKAGVKFNSRMLRNLALRTISDSSLEECNADTLDPRTGKPVSDHVSARWVQHFMQRNNIVSRSQAGKLQVSTAKQDFIEREVAFHLGKLCREFNSRGLDEDCVYNADETHFAINMHNHKTVSVRGSSEVKYADVVSGDEGMTMMVTIRGGALATLCPAFMIFKNKQRSYPIQGLPDNIPGVAYRTQPEGWMDGTVFLEWVR